MNASVEVYSYGSYQWTNAFQSVKEARLYAQEINKWWHYRALLVY